MKTREQQAVELLQTFVESWDGVLADEHQPIDGAAAVDYIAGFYQDCQRVLAAPAQKAGSA